MTGSGKSSARKPAPRAGSPAAPREEPAPASDRLTATGWTEYALEAPREEALLDLSEQIRPALRRALRRDGLLALAVDSPLVSLALLDGEPGARADFAALLERLAPRAEYYQVNLRAPTERTGHARLRAALLDRSLVIPYRDRRPLLPEGVAPHAVRHEPARTPRFTLLIGLL